MALVAKKIPQQGYLRDGIGTCTCHFLHQAFLAYVGQAAALTLGYSPYLVHISQRIQRDSRRNDRIPRREVHCEPLLPLARWIQAHFQSCY